MTDEQLMAAFDSLRSDVHGAKLATTQQISALSDTVGQLRGDIQRVEQELRGDIRRVEQELRGQIERSEEKLGGQIQELRQQLGNSEQKLREEMGNSEQKLREEIQQAKDEGIAASRDMQTEVLRYIANIAEGFVVRMRHLEANAGNMDTAERLRLAAVEERLLRIERRAAGLPPPSDSPQPPAQ